MIADDPNLIARDDLGNRHELQTIFDPMGPGCYRVDIVFASTDNRGSVRRSWAIVRDLDLAARAHGAALARVRANPERAISHTLFAHLTGPERVTP